MHHTGGRKSEDARRSMEAFALMREQLKREREIKADLLEACRVLVDVLNRYGVPLAAHGVKLAKAALAKAEGQ